MGEKKYRVENVFTRDKITIPERFLETYRDATEPTTCLLYTSPSPRDRTRSRMPSSA